MKKMYCLVVTDDFSRFSWVFFLATKDETSEILKTFITGIENLINLRVKVIRCDNETEFKNRVMNQFYEWKGIKREFSVARTPQQNGVAERKNRIIIEAAKTMLADSKLPTTFWAKAVNTTCYIQNRVLVIKPHNKTPYDLFLGRKLALSFIRPFGCHVTILHTVDHLGSGPNWLFDIDALTKSINYKPVVIGNQFDGNRGTKASDNVGKSRVETIPGKDYILLPLWPQDPQFSSTSKDSPDARFKPLGEEEKKDAEDSENKDSKVPSTEEPRVNQEKDANINNTNNINTISLTVNAAGIEDNAVDENIVYGCADDPNMPNLEEIMYSDDDEDNDAKVDINNLNTFMPISPIPTTRLHKDHPLKQIIRDIHSAPQTRRMTKSVTEHEPKKVIQALKDPSWIEAMQEELLQLKLQQVWTLVDLPYGKRAIGYTQEKGIDYDEVFVPVAKIEVIRLFLAYASYKDFVVYQMNVKSAFLYGKIEEEVYVCQPPGFEDPDFPDRVYKVEKALYGLHQAPRAWPDIMFDVCACSRFQFTPEVSHLHAVKRILRYLKGQPKLGLWYPKDSPFDLEAYTDSDYAENADFDEIVDFLNANPIQYSLTVSPTIYVSYFEQFWSTVKTKTVNNETQIRAKVDGKTIVITESSMRKDLHFNDEDEVFKDEYDTPSHTKKVFVNMRRQGKDFSRNVTRLFATMLIQSQAVEGEADETVHEERGDSIERAATTAISLDVEQGSGNIIRTQSMVTLNEPIPQGTGSGSGPRRQDTILGDRPAQTRVLALENIKTAQDLEITNLKKRVKKLEKKKKLRTPQLKRRLFKVRIESSVEKSLETQGRYGHDTEINTASTSITTASINITTAEPVITASAPIATAGVSVSTAEPNFDAIKQMFDKAYKQVNDFVPMDTESSKKKAVSKKRAGKRLSKESVKIQKIEDDAEKAELKACLEIVPGDDSAVNIESLATKYPIVDWKTHILAEDKMYYQIIRADGSTKYYKIFSAMLNDFD
ncbi:ribonuclease H-like domain-containing protein [Tanacetum coccineum]